jgi:hypothetical protein
MNENKDKIKTIKFGEYLVSDNGVKSIKPAKTKNANGEYVNEPITLSGEWVMYVNIFDEEFRAKYEIPAFKKGSISLRVNEDGSLYQAKPGKGGLKNKPKTVDEDDVNF